VSRVPRLSKEVITKEKRRLPLVWEPPFLRVFSAGVLRGAFGVDAFAHDELRPHAYAYAVRLASRNSDVYEVQSIDLTVALFA
jgi:hypothetical protein